MLVSKLLLVALGIAFFGSMLVASMGFPGGYDWRHTVMSSLASPVENPHSYRVVSYGMAISGILLSSLAFQIRYALSSFAPTWTAWAQGFFIVGGILLTISALITPGYHTFLGLPKAHAKLAQAAGAGFIIGMVLNLPALLRTPVRDYWARRSALCLICVPLSLFLFSWFVLPPLIPVTSPFYEQDIRNALWESLAFWEWLGSVSVYLLIVLLTTVWRRDSDNPANLPVTP